MDFKLLIWCGSQIEHYESCKALAGQICHAVWCHMKLVENTAGCKWAVESAAGIGIV